MKFCGLEALRRRFLPLCQLCRWCLVFFVWTITSEPLVLGLTFCVHLSPQHCYCWVPKEARDWSLVLQAGIRVKVGLRAGEASRGRWGETWRGDDLGSCREVGATVQPWALRHGVICGGLTVCCSDRGGPWSCHLRGETGGQQTHRLGGVRWWSGLWRKIEEGNGRERE